MSRRDKKISELEEEFDAIFIGIGSTLGNYPGIKGEDASNVHLAMEFLTGIQKRNFGNKDVVNASVHVDYPSEISTIIAGYKQLQTKGWI